MHFIGLLFVIFYPNAGGGRTQTLDLGMRTQVFLHCASAGGLALLKAMFTLVKFRAIMPTTVTSGSPVFLVGATEEIGSFQLFVVSPKVAKARTVPCLCR